MAPPTPPELKIPYRETPEDRHQRIFSAVMTHAEQYLYPAFIEDCQRPGTFVEVPFHNFPHATGTYKRAVALCDYAEENNREPDREALAFAPVLHDADVVRDLAAITTALKRTKIIRNKPRNKEGLSAIKAGLLLESFGVEPACIGKTKRLIRVTAADVIPRTLEEKIMVRADLGNITQDGESFLLNTLKIVREAELLNGPKNPYERMLFLHGLLSQYISHDLSLGAFDKDNYDRLFRRPAFANTARLSASEIVRSVRSLGRKATETLPSLRRAA